MKKTTKAQIAAEQELTAAMIESKAYELSELIIFGKILTIKEREDMQYGDGQDKHNGERLSDFENGFKIGGEYVKTWYKQYNNATLKWSDEDMIKFAEDALRIVSGVKAHSFNLYELLKEYKKED